MHIGSGYKRASAADDDDGARLPIGIGLFDRSLQPLHHSRTQRVDGRIVDGDDRDILIALETDPGIHAFNFRASSTALWACSRAAARRWPGASTSGTISNRSFLPGVAKSSST